MLVLTRKAGEQIIIQGDIRITIVSVGPGRVKIGVDAPSDVRVDRAELLDRTQDRPQAPAAVDTKSAEVAKPKMPLPTGLDELPVIEATTPMMPFEQPPTLHNRIAQHSAAEATKTGPVGIAVHRPFKRQPR